MYLNIRRNMPGQADDLIERLKNDSRIDFEKDWKMVTLFVGGNDLCGSCRRWVGISVRG
jgi:phospholipase B1